MKVLEQAYGEHPILHHNSTAKDVMRRKYSDTCVLTPPDSPLPKSLNKDCEYVKAFQVRDRESCEDRSELGHFRAVLTEIPE